MQQPLVGVADKIGVRLMPEGNVARSVPGGDDFDDHLTLLGELHGIADEVDEDLP